LTGWVCVPNSASRNATSSFEPTWIMTCLLLAPLVGANGRGVQDNRVSAMFQACFVETENDLQNTIYRCLLKVCR